MPTSIASPELTGGSGFTFEDRVAATYLAAVLAEATPVGILAGRATKVEIQRAAFGHPMDDVVVTAQLQDGSNAVLALQVKRALTISAAESNDEFRDIVRRAWSTVKGAGFRFGVDRVGAATGSVAEGPKRALRDVCEWARLSPTLDDFETRFVAGASGDSHRHIRSSFADVLKASDFTSSAGDVHRLLASFVLVSLDLLHEGATDEAHSINLLRSCLRPSDAARAEDLFGRLTAVARDASGRAGQFTRTTLIHQLRGRYRLSCAPSFHADLVRLREEAERGIAEIEDTISGLHVPRTQPLRQIDAALRVQRFVQVTGLPGSGKSAVLRTLVQRAASAGFVLFLKADRLRGRGWNEYATALGLHSSGLESLLAEIGAAGTSTLFIDGLDRVEVQDRAIVNDILNLLADSGELGDWRVVATVRDNGMEPLRTWLSPKWLATGATNVEVPPLNDEESNAVATAHPNLRPLLIGPDPLRELMRRPFFLSVAARLSAGQSFATETDLIGAWWRAGGYNTPPEQAGERQRTLIALAQSGAASLGRRMPVSTASASSVSELRADGVLKDLKVGHTVAFRHDIYFEWAFLHLLIDRGDAWTDALRAVGEPPVLGRVVELLAQVHFQDPPQWTKELGRLRGVPMRSQWYRAWLLGPFGSANFSDQADQMSGAAFDTSNPELRRLTVWFQAEKTTPNPGLVRSAVGAKDVQLTLRLADHFAVPSDSRTWGRFIDWLFKHSTRIPKSLLPDVLSVFEVWQNLAADFRNPRSEAILTWVEELLLAIEDARHPEFRRPASASAFAGIPGELSEFESRLRQLYLRAARSRPEKTIAYLDRLSGREGLGRAVVSEVFGMAPVLVDVQPSRLVDYALNQLLDELPEDRNARMERNAWRHYGFDSHLDGEWRRLAIDKDIQVFAVASPLEQPFSSLFNSSPDEGRRLVRTLSNHAVKAWRQLHAMRTGSQGRDSDGSVPIPIELRFPWGHQTFWGDQRMYTWSRGIWGPHAAQSGLMALETWAFEQLDQGRDFDRVLEDVVEGHEGVGVLGVAVAMLLRHGRATPAGIALIGSSRIWAWDIQRMIHDGPVNSNTIPFVRSVGSPAHKAVLAGNALAFRRHTLRDLAPLFVLSEHTAKSSRALIDAFPDAPPIDMTGELEEPSLLDGAKRTATIWSKLADPSTYRHSAAPDGGMVQVQHVSPHAEDPDVVDTVKRSEDLEAALGLVNWARDCFDKNAVSPRLPLDKALESAKGIDSPELFIEAFDFGLALAKMRAVAGVAAAALAFGRLDSSAEHWARDAVSRATRTREPEDFPFVANSVVPDHPAAFAAKGLAAIVRREGGAGPSGAQLLRLALHPLHAISATALGEAMSCWDVDPNFAWTAFDLGLRLSVGRFDGSSLSEDQRAFRRSNARALKLALRRLKACCLDFTLPDVPKAWVQVEHQARLKRTAGPPLPQNSNWSEPDTFLRYDFLPKVLVSLPVEKALRDKDRRGPLLAFTDQLLQWTVQKLRPPWLDEPNYRQRDTIELIDWQAELGRFLARISLQMQDVADVRHRYLDRIFELEDESAFEILAYFVSGFLAAGVLDAPTVHPSTLPIASACLERVLGSDEWDQARKGDGDLHDRNLTLMLVPDLLFVRTLDASLAVRFANGDWSDLDIVWPMIETMVRAVGDVPLVAQSFLQLCEHAVGYIRPEAFASLALTMVARGGTPSGWRAWSLPARLASVIQLVAERHWPLQPGVSKKLLRVLDTLVDMGDRRAAAMQNSETFKDVRLDQEPPM